MTNPPALVWTPSRSGSEIRFWLLLLASLMLMSPGAVSVADYADIKLKNQRTVDIYVARVRSSNDLMRGYGSEGWFDNPFAWMRVPAGSTTGSPSERTHSPHGLWSSRHPGA